MDDPNKLKEGYKMMNCQEEKVRDMKCKVRVCDS